MNDFRLAIISGHQAKTITLEEMAIKNTELVKKYFYFLLEDNYVWRKRALSSMEFRQAV